MEILRASTALAIIAMSITACSGGYQDQNSATPTNDATSAAAPQGTASPATTTEGQITATTTDRPYGRDKFGGGDAQFDEIVRFYDEEPTPELRNFAHQFCAIFDRDGFSHGGAGEFASANDIWFDAYAYLEIGGVFAYCPQHMEAFYKGGTS